MMHMRLPKTKEALALHYRCERGATWRGVPADPLAKRLLLCVCWSGNSPFFDVRWEDCLDADAGRGRAEA